MKKIEIFQSTISTSILWIEKLIMKFSLHPFTYHANVIAVNQDIMSCKPQASKIRQANSTVTHSTSQCFSQGLTICHIISMHPIIVDHDTDTPAGGSINPYSNVNSCTFFG
jgi:hypothetical protein